MDFELTKVQKMLQSSFHDFLDKECPEDIVRQMEDDEKGYLPELWHKIADLGWLGLIYPEQYGGTAGSIVDMAILYEEMGKYLFPSPHLSTVVLSGLPILYAGSEEQKADLLPKIAQGNLIVALALTEPQTSWDGKAWDPEGVTVSAVADGDYYVINGTKLFVYDVKAADLLLCVARTKEVPQDSITLFLVDATSTGISSTTLRTTASDRRQSEVVFDNVRVPKKNIIGELNAGWDPLEKAMQIGRVLLSAQLVGGADTALKKALDYAKTRIQFDMPIGVHNWIQEYCIWLKADVESCRMLVYETAWMLDEGLPCETEVSMTKAQANEAIQDALWRAHQVLAGIGFCTQDGILPLITKRSLPAYHYLGDTDYHLERIAAQIEKWPPPEKPQGKPLGIFDTPEDLQFPAWDVWRNQTKGKLW